MTSFNKDPPRDEGEEEDTVLLLGREVNVDFSSDSRVASVLECPEFLLLPTRSLFNFPVVK